MRRHVGFKSNFAYQYVHKTHAYTPINYSHIHVYYWMFNIYIYEIHVHTNMKSMPIHLMLAMNAYTLVNNLHIHINLTHAYSAQRK